MISSRLVAIVRCPDCGGRLAESQHQLRCESCGRAYGSTREDYLDVRPLSAFAEQTKYVDKALHADARHEIVSPPLLSAKIRNDMLRSFLRPGPGDRVVDLGCGSGRMLLWNRSCDAYMAGIDVSPFFAREARERMDLALGDLRKLPFADGSFDKAYAIDVLEHLSRGALEEVLKESARILRGGGLLFVYTHVRRNSRLAVGLRLINRLAHRLEHMGLIDLRQEHLRKSDHLNPLADIPDLTRVAAAAGLRIVRIRFYTPLIGGFVENILMRMAERALALRAVSPGHSAVPSDAGRAARTAAKRRIARRGPLYVALRALTWVMKLDVLLFGRVTSGPFFALMSKSPAVTGHRVVVRDDNLRAVRDTGSTQR